MTTNPALQFWDAEAVESHYGDWMACAAIRRYLNTRIGGSEHDWPFNWFVRFLGGRRLPRALSIACGTGALERDLIRRGICARVDAFDGSLASLAIAREEAKKEGYGDAIRYFAADFNHPALPRDTYDAVFFHHSLHHVEKLERLLKAVLRALKPDGLLYLDEYVGPSRTWWSDERFRREREIFETLVPRDARFVERLPLPIIEQDPSEAIRSGEILEQVEIGFDVIEKRGYGGNLLSVIYPAINWDRAPADLLDRLIEAERAHLSEGASDFLAIVVARPKKAMARRVAVARYTWVPRWKRVTRMF